MEHIQAPKKKTRKRYRKWDYLRVNKKNTKNFFVFTFGINKNKKFLKNVKKHLTTRGGDI